jgi:hypothetical protein
MTDKVKAPRVEFRGRLVPDHYPARHAQAQSITAYDDFRDGVSRERIKYGDPKDRYPGGITYAKSGSITASTTSATTSLTSTTTASTA